MNFADAIEEARDELGIIGFVEGEEWEDVLDRAREIMKESYEIEQPPKTTSVVPPRVIPSTTRYEVMSRQKWRCNSCGMKIRYSRDNACEGGVGHIDHIHPYSAALSYSGGPSLINEPSNLQALCETCNLRKGRSQKV